MKTIKHLDLFGGIGAMRIALNNLGFNVKSKYVDYDKKVVNVYNKLWEENNIPIDIRDFKGENGAYDLITAGFPCQPFSVAGKHQGLHDEKGRGDLFLETLRVVKEVNAPNVIFENVKGILSKKHKWIIDEISIEMSLLGYNVKVELLNSHDFNSVQTRQRVFIICSKNKIKPIWPTILTKTLKDYLETNVDASLYYDKNTLDKILAWKEKINLDSIMENRTRIPGLFYKTFNAENYITGEKSEKFGTLTASGANSRQRIILKDLKIRSITPRESWRLMGISDIMFDKVKDLPKTTLYFTAGNSMEINTITAVLQTVLKGEK